MTSSPQSFLPTLSSYISAALAPPSTSEFSVSIGEAEVSVRNWNEVLKVVNLGSLIVLTLSILTDLIQYDPKVFSASAFFILLKMAGVLISMKGMIVCKEADVDEATVYLKLVIALVGSWAVLLLISFLIYLALIALFSSSHDIPAILAAYWYLPLLVLPLSYPVLVGGLVILFAFKALRSRQILKAVNSDPMHVQMQQVKAQPEVMSLQEPLVQKV
jgi:hypothetical protein